MRCEQFERRLHELLDERPSTSLEGSLDESLRSHVDGCSGCRDLLFEY